MSFSADSKNKNKQFSYVVGLYTACQLAIVLSNTDCISIVVIVYLHICALANPSPVSLEERLAEEPNPKCHSRVLILP